MVEEEALVFLRGNSEWMVGCLSDYGIKAVNEKLDFIKTDSMHWIHKMERESV